MVKTPKYDEEAFLKAYTPLKAKGLSMRKISSIMDISTKTLQKYLRDYDITLTKGIHEKLKEQQAQEGKDHSKQIIEVAYKLHERGIKEAIERLDYEKARQISIEALKIARTEAEIRRIFNAVNVSIDNRTQILNISFSELPEEKREEYRDVILRNLIRENQSVKKCPLCGMRVRR